MCTSTTKRKGCGRLSPAASTHPSRSSGFPTKVEWLTTAQPNQLSHQMFCSDLFIASPKLRKYENFRYHGQCDTLKVHWSCYEEDLQKIKTYIVSEPHECCSPYMMVSTIFKVAWQEPSKNSITFLSKNSYKGEKSLVRAHMPNKSNIMISHLNSFVSCFLELDEITATWESFT